MAFNRIYSQLFLIIVLFTDSFFTNYLFASPMGVSIKELNWLRKKETTIWVSSEEALLYPEPNLSIKPLGKYKWMQTLMVDDSRLDNKFNNWIPVKAMDGGNVENPFGAGWVRYEDIVIGSQFKKVIGCWPIKSLTYELGDYAADFAFNINGTGKVKEYSDDPDPKAPVQQKVEIYMEHNIVKIAYLHKPHKYLLIAGYRPEEHKLYPDGVFEKKQMLFSEKLLKNCKAVPLVSRP